MKNKTLLIDGNALFKTAYYGVKYTSYKGNKIGGIYSSLSMIRKLVNENQVNRIVVMWDGDDGIRSRVRLYPGYKSHRKQDMAEKEFDNYQFQKVRIKEYLEELFIRQYITQNCEADDAIAYYVHNRKPNESILIVTNDRDILQLLSEDVNVYLLDKKYIINPNNFQMFFPYYYKNVKLLKIITGDKSDAIHAIYGLGSDTAIEKLIDLVPAIRTREVTLNEVFAACEAKKDETICQERFCLAFQAEHKRHF
jgi:DNA polymerase-1